MNTSELIYQGNLRTLATHIYSGAQIITDAPLDNQGKAESFSPTDLVTTALASCIITTLAILMKSDNINWEDATLFVRKKMTNDPRRISVIEIDMNLVKVILNNEQRKRLEQISKTCPVAKSLHPDLKQTIHFVYC